MNRKENDDKIELNSSANVTVNKRRNNLKKLSLAAIFIALNIIFGRFLSIDFYVFRLSFAMLPIHMAGYLLGPVWGFAVGIFADLLGYLLNSYGASLLIGVTLTTGLQGLISGLVVKLNKKKLDVKSVVLSSILTTGICSILLMSLFLSIAQGKGINVLLKARAEISSLKGLIIMLVEILLLPVLKASSRYLPEDVEVVFASKKKTKDDAKTNI